MGYYKRFIVLCLCLSLLLPFLPEIQVQAVYGSAEQCANRGVERQNTSSSDERQDIEEKSPEDLLEEQYTRPDGSFDYDGWRIAYAKYKKSAMGFVNTDGIGVRLNERALNIPVVQFTDGVSMVEAKGFFEAIGGTYYAANQVATYRDNRYYFTPNSKAVTVVAAETVQLSTATYEKSGVLYIPLRATAQLLGCEVDWNSMILLVDLYHEGAFVDDYNADFTILNQFLAATKPDFTKPIAVDGTVATKFCTASAQAATVNAMISGVVHEKDAQLTSTVSYDFTQVYDALMQDEFLKTFAQEYAKNPGKTTVSLVANSEKETMYIQSKELAQNYIAQTNNTIPQETVWVPTQYSASTPWLKEPIPGTVGDYLLTLYQEDIPVEYYQVMSKLYIFLADDVFVKSQNQYTAFIDKDTLLARIEKYSPYGDAGIEQVQRLMEFSFSVAISQQKNGKQSAQLQYKVIDQLGLTKSVLATLQHNSISVTAENVSKNNGSRYINGQLKFANTDQYPAKEPPPNSHIIQEQENAGSSASLAQVAWDYLARNQ